MLQLRSLCHLIVGLGAASGLNQYSIYPGTSITTSVQASQQNYDLVGGESNVKETRRCFLNGLSATISILLFSPGCSVAAEEDINAFNTLPFGYRNTGFGGLRASDVKGPSVSFADFLKRLDSNEVEQVEFMFPHGDEAYVTFKAKEGEEKQPPIRIGEGYPIEQPHGWSSPAFAIRSVKEKGVPYKFTVPMLENYK